MPKAKTAKAIMSCPKCRSTELMEFEGDHFCLNCSWDSLKMSVERGDLDRAIYEYEKKLADEKKAVPPAPVPPPVAAIATNVKSVDGSAA